MGVTAPAVTEYFTNTYGVGLAKGNVMGSSILMVMRDGVSTSSPPWVHSSHFRLHPVGGHRLLNESAAGAGALGQCYEKCCAMDRTPSAASACSPLGARGLVSLALCRYQCTPARHYRRDLRVVMPLRHTHTLQGTGAVL